MSDEFNDRVALVTGGSRGIGRAIALELARRGADVALSYVSRREQALEVASRIEQLGRRAVAVPCDVSRAEDVARLVTRTREELGPIDLLAHNAAILTNRDHGELTYETWHETIDVNLNGAFRVVFAVKDEMIRRRFGRIVMLSSVSALRARKVQIHYSAAKAGVIGMARSCAEAFAPHNVRVNCVAPGLIDTDMARDLPAEKIAALIEATPIQRIGQPEEIATLVCFLLGEDSSFMTGQTLVASGGRVTLP